MFRPKGLIMAMALVCVSIMAVNPNTVLADDAVELEILKQVKKVKRTLNQKVLPRLEGVPETGQTFSYAAGDDGALQRGTKWPKPRFTDNGDGTVTDNMTGLIWLKDGCFLSGTWSQALTYCGNLADGDCGLTDGSVAGDWRLPNIRELVSLVNYGYVFPALSNTAGTGQWTDGDPFTGMPPEVDYYWSSTTDTYSAILAWGVNIGVGFVVARDKSSTRYVWPVRGGS